MESIAYTTFCLETPPLSGVLDCSAPSAPLFSGYFKLSWAVMGSATLASISFAPVADAIVAQGDRCPEVKDIQNSLTTAQYSVGTIDGIFGAQTHAALVRFQIAKGLKGDGVVGPVTAKALGLEAKEVYALNTLCGTPAAKPSETASQRYIVVPNALNVRSGSWYHLSGSRCPDEGDCGDGYCRRIGLDSNGCRPMDCGGIRNLG